MPTMPTAKFVAGLVPTQAKGVKGSHVKTTRTEARTLTSSYTCAANMTAWPKNQSRACCKAQPEVETTDGNNIPSKLYRLETQ